MVIILNQIEKISHFEFSSLFFIVSDIDQPRVISSSETLDTSSHPRLIEKEIYLEKLRCEQQRYKQIVENGKLEQEKLIKETDQRNLSKKVVKVKSPEIRPVIKI